MARVFMSYSHRDEDLRNELETHLAGLKRQGVITVWHDRRIARGEEFHGRIGDELNAADIVLVLVSPDFIASDYCYDVEMTRALERHDRGEARVIPVILRPCDWQGAPFGHLMAVPKDGKPVTRHQTLDDGFLEVAKAIRQVAGLPDTSAAAARRPDPPAARRHADAGPVFELSQGQDRVHGPRPRSSQGCLTSFQIETQYIARWRASSSGNISKMRGAVHGLARPPRLDSPPP